MRLITFRLRAWYRLCCLMVAKLGGQLFSVLLVVFFLFLLTGNYDVGRTAKAGENGVLAVHLAFCTCAYIFGYRVFDPSSLTSLPYTLSFMPHS